MEEAFDLADYGLGRTHPNPLVGAVIVKDDEVVGRGYHLGPGQAHAEAQALTEAGPLAAAPPCTSRSSPAATSGSRPLVPTPSWRPVLARVVVALRRPGPRVDGTGPWRGWRRLGCRWTQGDGRWAPRARPAERALLKSSARRLPLDHLQGGRHAGRQGGGRPAATRAGSRAPRQPPHRAPAPRRLRRPCSWAPAPCAATTRSSRAPHRRRGPGTFIVTSEGEAAAAVQGAHQRRPRAHPSWWPWTQATPAARQLLEARGGSFIELFGPRACPTALATARRTRVLAGRAVRGRAQSLAGQPAVPRVSWSTAWPCSWRRSSWGAARPTLFAARLWDEVGARLAGA